MKEGYKLLIYNYFGVINILNNKHIYLNMFPKYYI